MAIITLLTDFGTSDVYAGMMKGVILSINSHAAIVDITHDIEPQDIVQAAYLIKSSYPFFPQNTIHVVVVDPGVGSDRQIIAVKADNHVFVAPDNGVLGLILHDASIESLVRVQNSEFMSKTISNTFHGRDIFAPVAAHLSLGVEISQIGPLIERQDLVDFFISNPRATSNANLSGSIVAIDRFGNLMTNISEEVLERRFPAVSKKTLIIEINGQLIDGISDFYENVSKNKGLALIGSHGYLEVSVNCGNAQTFYNVKKGEPVHVFVKQ